MNYIRLYYFYLILVSKYRNIMIFGFLKPNKIYIFNFESITKAIKKVI